RSPVPDRQRRLRLGADRLRRAARGRSPGLSRANAVARPALAGDDAIRSATPGEESVPKDIGVSLENRVGTIEIRRPPNNFFDNALINEIGDAMEAFDGNPDCRAVVLCAEGKAFCAGADFSRRTDPSSTTSTTALPGAKHLYKEATRLFR